MKEVLVVRVHPEILRARGWQKNCADEKTNLGGAVSFHRGLGSTPPP